MSPPWRGPRRTAVDRQEDAPGLGSSVAGTCRFGIAAHLLLILFTAVWLRVRGLGQYSFWYDEVVTMRLARTAGPRALIGLLGQIDGTRAPLHPLVLQGWVKLFGDSETAGRSFSAVCGIGTVLAVYQLGRRLWNDQAGRWAAWLAAVCPPLVYHAQEARMYAWLVLVACLSWLLFLEFRRTESIPLRIAYGLMLTALVYSHPVGLFMVAAHIAAYLLVRRSLALGFRSWLVILAGVLLAIAPWLPRYLDHGTDYPLPRYSLRVLLAVPIEYIGGNSLVLLACILVIAAGLFTTQGRRPRLSQPVESGILLCWLVVPPVLMFVESWLRQPIFGPGRYHLFIAPAYLLLLAHGLCMLPGPLRWALALGAFCLSIAAIEASNNSPVVKADWRALGQWLSQETQGNATIAIHPSDSRFPRDEVEAARYYLSPRHRVVLGSGDSAGASAGDDAATFDVYCLSAQQVRAGVRSLSDLGPSAPVWQRTATARQDDGPDHYGMIVRRR